MSAHLGELFLSPSDIAKMYCQEKDLNSPQFKLVVFFDSDKKTGKAFRSNEDGFCKTVNENLK